MNENRFQQYALGGVILAHLGVCALLMNLGASRVAITPPKAESLTLVSLAPATPTPPAPRAAPKPVEPKPAAQPVAKPQPKPQRTPLLTAKAPSAAAPAFTAPAEPAPAPAPAAPAAASHGEKADKPATVTPPTHQGGYLNNPRPAYPPLSIEQGEEGKVLLRVRVGTDGRAESVELERSSGFPRLDRAALTAVRGWRFTPARRGDEAIAFTYTVPLDFSIKKQTQS